ncbi:MAG: hypothetical protein KDM81_02465, partial [Verrucomicrobiae bacterium]|nr:hypothetical protein [Verrucomicrobiae bacterium]
SGYPLELQRNHTFTFTTTTTDADGDSPYYYRYEILPPGSSAWLALTNTSASFTNGWSGSSQLTITPVLTDPDLLPPATAGVNTNTFV